MHVQLAGKLDQLGDSWLATLGDWGDKGLNVALIGIVVITVVRKVSLKAGIGALIGLVLALGIYNSRTTLADLFEDEVRNPATGAGIPTVVVPGQPDRSGGVL
ncbi:hypothetical protein OHA27_38065 [Streptomyces sp. NBC_01619]|uniref:hypothetical protein n=1 Tax=Streptomyces sp. NBC_01619 TaxID=2975901 RepID=UPI00224DE8AD|nr:hypothetical protein [Streptomyces sp. NBC_01619]MCX4515926.1 hypothetical protein [Streptomyces sp. NBC_01619]